MSDPIEEKHRATMNALAQNLDELFNGRTKGPARQTGFCLLVWPMNATDGRANYISNGADRRDMIPFLRETAARFERDAAKEDGKKLSPLETQNRLNMLAEESAALLASIPITNPAYPFLTAAVERAVQALDAHKAANPT